MSNITPAIEVPSVVASKLRVVRRRGGWMRLLEGALLTATVLAAAMTLAVAVDWLVVFFEPTWRIALTAVALVGPVAVFLWRCVVPLVTPRRISDVALEVDRAVPVLEERWSTVAELSESRDPPAVRGADGFIRQVAVEATRMSDVVQANQVVTPERVRRRGLELAAAIVPILAAFAVSPTTTKTLVERFWLPTRPITLTQVTAPAGDFYVPRGEAANLRAELGGRIPSTATLYLRRDRHDEQFTLAPAGSPAALQHTIASVQEPFDYRFRAGDGQTAWHRVGIEDRPSITGIIFRITPPAYSKLPVDRRDSIPNRCRALKGSRLEMALQASKPLASLTLAQEDGQSRPLVMTTGGWYRLEQTLEESVSFTVRLVDRHALENLAPPTCRIVVYEDQPPQVRITSPQEDITLRPDDKVKIEFKAQDDLGIAAAELVVTTGEGTGEKVLKTAEIPLGAQQGARKVDGKTELDLKPFGLKQGQVLNYAIRVRDTQNAAASSQRGIRGDEAGSQPAGGSPASQPVGEKGAVGGQSSPKNRAEQQTQEQNHDAQTTRPVQPQSKLDTTTRPASAGVCKKCGKSPCQCQGSGNAKKKEKENKEDEEKDRDQQQGEGGKRPPPNNMSKRQLSGGEGCTSSSKHRIRVDEWAGSFEGQAREKLQIAVDEYLERLKKDLADAEPPTLELRDQAQPGSSWDGAKGRKLQTARDLLADAEQTTTQLKSISANTPYAFVGLQLHEIVQSHVMPAREELADAALFTSDPVRQRSDFEQAALHIAQARKMLGDVIRQYEDVKREQKVKDLTEQVAKMHQLFIEDMQALLKLKKGQKWLNPRTGKMVEVTDAFMEQLKQHYEQLKKLLDELAKALANDPDLLRRFMARTKLEGMTLRDQLTVLAHRQKAIAGNVADWYAAAPGGLPALRRTIDKQHAFEQVELTEAAAKLYENMETWAPRGLDRDEGALLEGRTLASKIAIAGKDLATTLAAGQVARSLEQGEQLLRDLRLLDERLTDMGQDNPNHQQLSIFITHRMEEIARLRLRESNLLKRLREVQQGKFGRAAGIAQRELIDDTAELGGKLDRIVGMLAGLSAEAGTKAQALADMVSATIPADQDTAAKLLLQPQTRPAHEAETKLVAEFDQAEKLFDELLTLVENAVAAKGSPSKTCKLPTLEELLKMLENECKACEKLGALVRLNVEINSDWMGDGEGSGGGSGKGSGSGSGEGSNAGEASANGKTDGQGQASDKKEASGKSEKKDSGQADKSTSGRGNNASEIAKALARAAEAMTKQDQEGLKKLLEGAAAGDLLSGTGKPGPVLPERDWNVLVSKLQDGLRQIRDHVPPEQYQQAIDAYFKSIADMVTSESEKK